KKNTIWFSYIQIFLFYTMNKSDIHSFDKDLPTFSTEEPKSNTDTVFTKLYTENTEEKITIYDLSGDSTDITIFVTGIGSVTGEETKPGEDGKPGDSEKPETEDTEKTDGEDTATNMYAGIFGGFMAAAVAGLGVLGLLKRKKK
ncbi:hypothetical protein, partial [Faecalicoccus pleomorphus]|uniref:hypothetical protein n=1 Tax=Faecalicoccus pleomorphus TaxID=1323 RepID=UPI0019622581